MNIMEVDGYKARISYDDESDEFRGEILGINGSADFYGNSPLALRREFSKTLKTFLALCEEQGVDPGKEYSGKFNLRIAPELHSVIAAMAAGQGKSINEWVGEVLRQAVED